MHIHMWRRGKVIICQVRGLVRPSVSLQDMCSSKVLQLPVLIYGESSPHASHSQELAVDVLLGPGQHRGKAKVCEARLQLGAAIHLCTAGRGLNRCQMQLERPHSATLDCPRSLSLIAGPRRLTAQICPAKD